MNAIRRNSRPYRDYGWQLIKCLITRVFSDARNIVGAFPSDFSLKKEHENKRITVERMFAR